MSSLIINNESPPNEVANNEGDNQNDVLSDDDESCCTPMNEVDTERIHLEQDAENAGLSLYEYLRILDEINQYVDPDAIPYDPQWPIDYISSGVNLGSYYDEGEDEYMY
mgnify:CR=1 FL=1|tara:strand:+ start:1153 stop:1479 length:327 start_codon:yes stop_codon:yes gene_type:complete